MQCQHSLKVKSRYLGKELTVTKLLCAEQVGAGYGIKRRARGLPFTATVKSENLRSYTNT